MHGNKKTKKRDNYRLSTSPLTVGSYFFAFFGPMIRSYVFVN